MLVENRNGLIAGVLVTEADGLAERDAALLLLHERWRRGQHRATVGADKGYDVKELVQTVRAMNLRAHVTQKHYSALDARTTPTSQLSEEPAETPADPTHLRLDKSIAGLKKVKLRGLRNVDWLFVLTAAAYNLLRIPKLELAGV